MTKKIIGLVLLSLLLVPFPAQAQQPGKVHRIGYLTGNPRSAISDRSEAFRQGLRELGYIEGKNIVIEWRLCGGQG
jgi:putative ABC transport system substrate-binding protein